MIFMTFSSGNHSVLERLHTWISAMKH